MRYRPTLAWRLIAILFGVTTLATATVVAGIYLTGVRQPMNAVRGQVAAEAAQLRAIYLGQGEEPLKAALARRRQAASPNRAFDALLDKDGALLAGNLPNWPAAHARGWVNIEADLYRDGDEHDHEALSLDMLLPGERRLIIGRDVEVFADRQELMGEMLLWGSLSVLIFGLIGAVVISRITGRRLNAVSRTARAVMEGDLTTRVPVKGSGGDEFDRLGLTLNAMLDRNLELVTSVSRVSDNIAHELRTPLARLRMALDEARGDGAIDVERAQVARSEAERLQTIFDALLRIARLDTGKHRIRRDPVQLDEILADAADFYAPEAEARGQSFTVSVAPCTVEGDRDLLFQAVANLIDNALKFAPEGGQVRADLTVGGAAATLAVRDNGPGVPEELRPRLKERFFRAPGTEAKSGTGLGLTLVNAIAQAHGGSLKFSGGPGDFAASLCLPLARGAAT